MQVTASSYSLVVDPETANRARNVLGLAAEAPVVPVARTSDAPPAGPAA